MDSLAGLKRWGGEAYQDARREVEFRCQRSFLVLRIVDEQERMGSSRNDAQRATGLHPFCGVNGVPAASLLARATMER